MTWKSIHADRKVQEMFSGYKFGDNGWGETERYIP